MLKGVAAVVGWYPLTDARGAGDQEGDVLTRLLGARPVDVPELAARLSPVTHVTAEAPPFLLVHGRDDATVPAAQSEALHRLLVEAGAQSTYQPVPGADHCFEGYGDIAGLIETSVAFFSNHL